MSAIQTFGLSISAPSESKARRWTGRILTGLVVLFLLFDGITKVVKERHVLQAAADLGYSANVIAGIGVLFDEIKMERKGAVLRATLAHDAGDLADVVSRLLEAKSWGSPPAQPLPNRRLDAGAGD